MHVTPPRPKMHGGSDEQARSVQQSSRWLVLEEKHQELADDWREKFVQAEASEAWGPSDLSVNPLAEIATQLSTPGLYGSHPQFHNSDAAAELTIQTMAEMGYWTKMQRVEYYARGIAEMVVRLEVVEDPTSVSARLVRPSDVWAKADKQRQDTACQVAELRLMWWADKKEWVYVWELFDIESDEPSHRIVKAEANGDFGDDLSRVFLPKPDGTFGPLVGEEYPYRYEDGRPFIPYVIYHLVDSGRLWNPTLMRGAHLGTMNAILYWTYAGHCARAASGSFVMAAGLIPMGGVDMTTGPNASRIRHQVMTPGMVAYHEADGDAQPFVTEVGPGGHLETVAEFASNYSMQIATRMGLNPADVTRQHANPTSGAALYISNKGKREMSKRLEPMFRRGDLEAVAKVSALIRIADLGAPPERGYSVTYTHPPESPAEESDRRDDIDWRRENGFLSSIEAYQELYPGTTREAAINALIQAREDEAELDRRAAQIDTQPAPSGAEE